MAFGALIGKTSGRSIKKFSNGTARLNFLEARVIFEAPDKTAAALGMQVAGADAQMVIEEKEIEIFDLKHDTAISIELDTAPGYFTDYKIKTRDRDGAGLVVCSLRKA